MLSALLNLSTFLACNVEKKIKKMKPAKMVTQGFIYSKDKQEVKTFASYDEDSATFSDINIIPRGCILKTTKILL